MAKEKVQFSEGDLDKVIEEANEYLKGKRGWDVIQLTYGCRQGSQSYIIAFTAVSKADAKTRKFIKTELFEEISGNKPVGIMYVNDVPWFVGSPER